MKLEFRKRFSRSDQPEWDMIIRAQRGWWDLRLGELWHYRDLIRQFVWRDFVAYYKQTILGPIWYLVQPILTTLVFTVIFGNVAKLPTDGLPSFLFYLAGNTVWSYFSACLVNTSNTFTDNAALFGKVYFPRLSIPVSVVISNLISFAIRMGLFLALWGYFLFSGADIQPNLWIATFPLLVLMMAGMGLGLGIIVSSLTSKYRDLRHLVTFGVQLLIYATPIVYPMSSVQGKLRLLLLANPMTPIVEIFRLAFLGESSLEPYYLLYSAGFAIVVFFIGVLIFNRVEATFLDTV